MDGFAVVVCLNRRMCPYRSSLGICTCYSGVAQTRVCVVHVWRDQLKDAGNSHTLDLAIRVLSHTGTLHGHALYFSVAPVVVHNDVTRTSPCTTRR